MARILCDPGSQVSFITERFANVLNLHRSSYDVSVEGIGALPYTRTNGMVTVTLKSTHSQFSLAIHLLVIKSITSVLPTAHIYGSQYKHLGGLQMTCPHFGTPESIDILLGANIWGLILVGDTIKGCHNEPHAQLTNLGWVTFGPATASSTNNSDMHSYSAQLLEQSRLKRQFYEIIEEVITQIFPNCTELMTDNEIIFSDVGTTALMKKLQIKHILTAVHHSTSNAQVERLHSTILEIARTLAADKESTADEEIFQAVKEYNKTLHSVTEARPVDVIFNRNLHPDIAEKIKKKRNYMLEYHNKKRKHREFQEGQIIYEKTDRRDKSGHRYTKHIVKEL